MNKKYKINSEGYYGNFGGAYVPEALKKITKNLQDQFLKISKDEAFKKEFLSLLKDYVGRPSPLYFASRLSKKYGAKIYLKREDLNHTGSHKINNCIGQILLAKKMGKKKIIAETGAGQHGLAVATVCALMDMPCTIYMGAIDVERQLPNVRKIKLLGAKVVPVQSGAKILKDAVDAALAAWCKNPDEIYYLIGSAVGPHPYPEMVARFQSIISKEIKKQLLEKEKTSLPNYVIACVGGGSNASGAFYNFLHDEEVKLVVAEAGGLGVKTGKSAATLHVGKAGVIDASRTLYMQDKDGNVLEPYSISAGLDYPGIGPLFAHLHECKRINAFAITDKEALKAATTLMKLEGIIPAIESAHAVAVLEKMKFKKNDIVVVNLSGRGDKDMQAYECIGA